MQTLNRTGFETNLTNDSAGFNSLASRKNIIIDFCSGLPKHSCSGAFRNSTNEWEELSGDYPRHHRFSSWYTRPGTIEDLNETFETPTGKFMPWLQGIGR